MPFNTHNYNHFNFDCLNRNVIQQVAILSSVSISPLLQPTAHAADAASSSVSITSATVRQNGLPLLTTSAGHGYTYHEGMKVWVKVVDPWFAKSSFFSDPPRDASGDFGSFVSYRKGVLAQLQSAAMAGRLEKDVSFAQGLLTVDDTVQSAVTLTYLEVCDVICLNFVGDDRYFDV